MLVVAVGIIVIFISILIVIGLAGMMLGEDPAGCLILFGLLIFFVCWSGLVVRWLIFGG